MTTQKIEDYLTKQLFISKNIVTYRSLSREFGIHVNIAKNELAAFHTKNAKLPGQECSATYIVSGQVLHETGVTGKGKGSSGDMDVDMDYGFTSTPTPKYGFAGGSDQYEGDVVIQIRMTVVSEDRLEDAKAKYEKVTSMHVYSLSPSPIRDADLLCAPTRQVREIDNQKGAEMAKAVGRIVGSDIKMREGGTKTKGRAATTVKARPSAPRLKAGPSISSSAAVKTEEKGKEAVKEESKTTKQSGQQNFFASKPQAQTKEKEGSFKNSTEAKGKVFFGAASKPSASSAKTKEITPVPSPPPPKEDESKEAELAKRGTKRKSKAAVLSDDDETTKANSAVPSGPPSRRSSKPSSARSSPQPTKAMSRLRLHKGAILSDDEEDDERPKKKTQKKLRRKASHGSDDESGLDSEATNEANKALKSMMEIDDDQVEKIVRKTMVEALQQEEEAEPEQEAPVSANKDEDVEVSDDRETRPKPKPRKKREKKIVPVGRNGLKKRRVMKSRMRVDEKGYMVTEDYSSYESVDEEEEEETKEAAPAKKGNRGKRAASISIEKEQEPAERTEPDGTAVNAAGPSGGAKLKPTTKAASSSIKASTSNRTKGGQKQKTLNTFFGPPRAKK